MNRKLPGLMLVISTLSGAIAAQQGVGNSDNSSFWSGLPLGLTAALIYSFLGIIVLMIGFKIFDWITPFSLNREIEEKNNTAAGLIVAGIMIALGLIVAAAIL